MAYLALDIGLDLGWALWRSGDRTESGVKHLKGAGERDGVRFLALRRFLAETKARCEADKDPLYGVVYEDVTFRAFQNGVYAEHVWGAIWGNMLSWCAHHDIAARPLNVATIKKAVTGNGRCKKPVVTATIQQTWPLALDHNEADALAVLITAKKVFG